MLKKLVAKYGAVITGVVAKGPFSAYKGGIFQGFWIRKETKKCKCLCVFVAHYALKLY